MATKKKSSFKKGVKVGITLSAAAAAAYMLFGPDGKKHQKKLHDWANKVEKEVKKDVQDVKKTVAKYSKKPAAKKTASSAKKSKIWF